MDDRHFFASLLSYIQSLSDSGLSTSVYLSRLGQLIKYTIIHLTDSSNLTFTSSFSRYSFFINRRGINSYEAYLLHTYRKLQEDPSESTEDKRLELAQVVVDIIFMRGFLNQPYYGHSVDDIYRYWRSKASPSGKSFESSLPVYLNEIDFKERLIRATAVNDSADEIFISWGKPSITEGYEALFWQLTNLELLPLHCRLIGVEIGPDKVHFPSCFVFEPDSLYDVTAISECFGAFGTHEIGYLLRRFIQKPSSLPLIVGNLSNFFLDQLIFRPGLKFSDVKGKIFRLYPLALAQYDDKQVRQLLANLEVHFINIRQVISNELTTLGVTAKKSYIEPSFFSAQYGIQGRLDLFHRDENGATIVELKSGKPFKVNSYGLSNNHYHQTLLYDLLIQSVFGPAVKRTNFLLYSKESKGPLRYAPSLRLEQYEAMMIRNWLFVHDQYLIKSGDILTYFLELRRKAGKSLKGYQSKDLNDVIGTLRQLDDIEMAYCKRVIRFCVHEQFLSKMGDETKERLKGLTSLWRDDLDTKKEEFNILNHLEIVRNKSDQEDPIIELEISPLTAPLSNFRPGDLAVFYPDQGRKDSILRNQIFKCTILDLTESHVRIRIRSQQENQGIFREHHFWNLEHDVLENGFYAMTKSLYRFAKSRKSFRQLILGKKPPNRYSKLEITRPPSLTDEQYDQYINIISSEDYYLLWGPPGTGKTSVLFKEVANYYYQFTELRILVMAYTNRAVDEMCAALSSLQGSPNYIRIGSRFSTSDPYRTFLLERQLEGKDSRLEVRRFLQNTRIYVGTVASIIGKTDLFELVDFDVAIVDEASQILEPSLIGLLGLVPKFVLIGDHLQLPAVVMQKYNQTEVKDEGLRKLGITNLSDSLFERMFKAARNNEWSHAVGVLHQQGRMHRELMHFSSQFFYESSLRIMPGIDRLLSNRQFSGDDPIQTALFTKRLIFVKTTVDLQSDSVKVNQEEARKAAILVSHLINGFDTCGQSLREDSIGIITPYRAQVARIRQAMSGEDPLKSITVDTVERFQGGARDIIIFSTCLNFSFQLDSLISLSATGEDRKLNVAFTRAREQFILLGNEEILRENKLYSALIDGAYRLELTMKG